MPRSGGRLTLKGALNRNMPPSHLNPLTTEPSSKHASVCRLERELKAVKEENNRLRDHLEETRSALKEITSEASLEKFDERRINLLKMQNIQLQRQILLMSEALGSRSTAITEVENVLTWLSEKFRFYIGMDVRGAEVPVPRSELITMVDTSESARIKLFKNIENCSKENLSRSQMLMNPFLKPGQDTQFTVLDSCLGRLDCLSLKHVAQLESKLSRLYKELIQLSEYLNSRAETEQGRVTGGHMNQAVREREGTVVLRACALSRECAADLLSLSLLVPSAPWPPLKKPTMTEVTYEALASSLPTLPRGKAAMVQQCVTAALKACNHRCHMVAQEAGALREEVRFHQAVYQLQLDYVHQVFDALRQGYSEFELSTNDLVIQPMKKLLEAYRTLKTNTSHEGLREFLTVLKEQEPQWTNTIQKLDISDPQNQSGSVALSAFGEEFLASLDRLVLARQTQRDKATSQKEELKAAQHQLEEELRSLIRDREEQRNIAKEMKTENVKTNGDIFSDSKTELEISEVSHRSSSHKADESGEMITGLRPWLDDQDTNSSNAGGRRREVKLAQVLSQTENHGRMLEKCLTLVYPPGQTEVIPGPGRKVVGRQGGRRCLACGPGWMNRPQQETVRRDTVPQQAEGGAEMRLQRVKTQTCHSVHTGQVTTVTAAMA
ncbi:uncharacterized protein LOC143282473 [Babylonia areolata]|uniref:uncharacterized protein LOC143282473 n=1 Tax=Babylonia areolata TaxID=304850 RepID=UPI003FCEF059